jgi:lipid II:glycine glycyltransferase (peptidoglycan interpeptide bridge formation enzyme)
MSGPREATPAELEDWDVRAVDAPGGHVYQSRAWAEHRRASGWLPRFVVLEDGGRVLTLERPWPLIGGSSAYIPRGPAPVGADGAALAARQLAVSDALAALGADVVAADPEVPAADEAYVAAIRGSGFVQIEEIQPSRHRITLALDDGVDEMLAFGHIAKSTRQRIRGAESSGLVVVRHDGRIASDGVGEGFVEPAEAPEAALDRFYDLLLATGERRQFTFGPRAGFVGWWRAALSAGHLVYLEVHEGGPAGTPLAGLVLYRHGGRLSTVHSGDRAETRRTHPGALHLARWRAIQLAIREGSSEMDLGGADLPGARREPIEGEPMWGLYQHKLGFGGHWLALAGAHERVFRPRRYAAGRVAARVARLVRR